MTGRGRPKEKSGQDDHSISFADDTAAKTGRSARSVRRDQSGHDADRGRFRQHPFRFGNRDVRHAGLKLVAGGLAFRQPQVGKGRGRRLRPLCVAVVSACCQFPPLLHQPQRLTRFAARVQHDLVCSMTPMEKWELGKELERLERPKAEERQKAAGEKGASGGMQAKAGKPAFAPKIVPQQPLGKVSTRVPAPPKAEDNKTRNIIGQSLGMSGKSWDKLDKVMSSKDQQAKAGFAPGNRPDPPHNCGPLETGNATSGTTAARRGVLWQSG